MSEAEDAARHALAQKLDEDLDAFVQEKLKNPREHDPMDDITSDELAEELRNHPAFMKEFDPSKPLSPAMEALQVLKYDTEDAHDKADSYKDDGNHNFKLKKYRWAIDSYTEGIKAKAADKELNAILYSNRAAAHFHLGNFGSSYKDSLIALKFKADHMKAIHRAALCSLELQKYDNAIKWCDQGLKLKPDEAKLQELRTKADKLKRQQERDKRKQEAKKRKEIQRETKLLDAIQSRGVQLAGVEAGQTRKAACDDVLTSLEAPGVPSPKVQMDEQESLLWPVVFLYPEYQETDFIQSFHENVTFEDQIQTMFGPGCERAPWDTERKYKAENLELYFEDRKLGKLHPVKKSITLKELLKHKSYIVHGGTPGIILLVKGSPFAAEFRKRYK